MGITRNPDGQTFQLESDVLSVTINPERGADILSMLWHPTDTEILWRNRRSGGMPPRRGGYDADPRSYFDRYPGGIQELFPNAGPEAEVEGAVLPFHGEALRRPWTATVDGQTLTCSTVLTRYPFGMHKTFTVDDGVLRVSASVSNLAERELPVHWGFHPAFNTQTVAKAATVYGPFESLRSHPEQFAASQQHPAGTAVNASPVDGVGRFDLAPAGSRSADLLYAKVNEGWFGLKSAETDLLVTMTWPKEVFPELWIWEESHAPGGYPWWGSEHIVAVEPHTTSPFAPLTAEPEPFRVAGGENIRVDLTLGVQRIQPNQIPRGVDASGIAQLGDVWTNGPV